MLYYFSVSLTPADPAWVGAWWIGFLVMGLVAIIMSLPLMAFPRTLPGQSTIFSAFLSNLSLLLHRLSI